MTPLLFCISAWASAYSELESLLDAKTPNSWKQQIVISSQKRSASQELLLYGRRHDDLLYTRIELLSPAKWNGIKIAQIDAPKQSDPYLIYLPALKKVNAVKNRAQTPIGIDLSLMDLNLNSDDQVEQTKS